MRPFIITVSLAALVVPACPLAAARASSFVQLVYRPRAALHLVSPSHPTDQTDLMIQTEHHTPYTIQRQRMRV